jgi:DNA-binding NtrC family response regulator
VRELENIMHRAVLMAQGNVIDEQAILLPASSRPVAQAPAAAAPQTAAPAPAPRKPNELVGRTVGDVEKELILDTLDHCLGNRTQAAQVLGISIRTLRNKLKQYQDEGTPVKSATGGY